MSEKITIETKVLSENDRLAAEVRRRLAERRILALNLVSSPGSGKTSLLERTLGALGNTLRMALIAGDVQTENDASRLTKAGGNVVRPIVTGGACHLDASMVTRALVGIDLDHIDVLFIENVGNLVCPAGFDLGETHKVVIFSVTEGEDKPLKYSDMFRAADLMLLNKCDLLPHLDFDAELAVENARRVNPNIQVIRVSATSGEGLMEWLAWIKAGCHDAVAAKQKSL